MTGDEPGVDSGIRFCRSRYKEQNWIGNSV